MGTKETPTSTGQYYTLYKEAMLQKLQDIIDNIEDAEHELKNDKALVDCSREAYKNSFNIDLNEYNEYKENRYINGKMYADFKYILLHKKQVDADCGAIYSIYKLAERQRTIYNLYTDKALYEKAAAVTINQYKSMLKLYFNEVHKHLIMYGEAYTIAPFIGDLCINRVRVHDKARPKLNFAASRAKKAQLIAEGKHIYNQEEANYYAKLGMPYNAEDYRVFMDSEYLYEYVVLFSKYKDSSIHVFKVADYRGSKVRGKSNDQLVEECNRDINKICNLDVDVRTKLNMSLKCDIGLYTNFIRNEDQKSVRNISAYRKNRQ